MTGKEGVLVRCARCGCECEKTICSRCTEIIRLIAEIHEKLSDLKLRLDKLEEIARRPIEPTSDSAPGPRPAKWRRTVGSGKRFPSDRGN